MYFFNSSQFLYEILELDKGMLKISTPGAGTSWYFWGGGNIAVAPKN